MSVQGKQCPKCLSENPVEANFCRHCGNALREGKGLMPLVLPDEQVVSNLKREVTSLKSEKKRLADKLSIAQATLLEVSRKPSVKYSTHVLYTLVIALCVGTIIWLFYNRNYQNKVISELQAQNESQAEMLSNDSLRIQQLESNTNKLSNTLNVKNDEIKELSSVYPFIITSVDIKNQGEEYGSTIYAKNTTFIYDRINIKSYYTGSVTIYVKFYRPNGELSANDNSPSGYSYSQQIDLTKGISTYAESTGWGNKNKGFWKSGQYYMEFWYNNKCFFRKGFYVSSL